MTDTHRDLLIRGIAAAKAGDKKEAEFFLDWLLRLDPSLEDKKEAWFWLSDVSADPKEKRAYLEEILANDLWDARARRALALLDGKLKADEIVDPNKISATLRASDGPAKAQRFTCPTCGGRMAYTPDGQSLTCEYCDARQKMNQPGKAHGDATTSSDFIVGMATAQGHLNAGVVHVIVCQGCGASFVLPPATISKNCPYCQSAYVLEQRQSKETLIPNSIIPFSVEENAARIAIKTWLESQAFETQPRVAQGVGVYLPVWLFDVGGRLSVRYEVEKNEKWFKRSDEQVIQVQNVRVSASQHLPDAFEDLLEKFQFDARCAYDERYLSNWVAETYQVSMADASLTARQIAIGRAKPGIEDDLEQPNRDVHFSTADVQIEAYQLCLVPVWVTRFSDGNQIYGLWVNGQTGEIISEYESNRPSWLERLFHL